MKPQLLKLGQKVVITKLMVVDKGELHVGDVGTIVDNTHIDPKADFPTRGLSAYWLSYGQIRKYKEPKYLELKIGDKVKIRNYKKYPELCVDPTRRYLESMVEYIGTTHKVESVIADGSVRLSNGYAYCTPTLKRVKEAKPKEITVGSKVRVTALRGLDAECYGINVGDVYTVVKVKPTGNVHVELPQGELRCMFKDQIELVS